MAPAAARSIDHQTDIPATSRNTLFSPDDSAISLHPTSTSTHATASPTPPSTPYRGRPTARYPDSLSRVPLHRRGTSKTYECLEDLLREAGYKETRVFTPERDRNARSATEKDGGVGNTVRGSVGAVVDFIAGLVSRGSSVSRETAPLEDDPAQSASRPWSPPPSPLAHAIHIKNNRARRVPSRASLSRKTSSESIRRRSYVDLAADPSERTHTYQVLQLHQSSQGLPHHPRSYIKAHHHHRHLNDYSSELSSTKPNPSNARAYLRHMVSAPNIQPLAKRPSSEAFPRSHVHGREHATRPTFILNDEDSIAESDYESHPRVPINNEHEVHPPLPRNWIESVAKALLSGVGGPAAVTSDAASTRTAKTVSTRKSSALSDKSNQGERGRPLTRGTKPPLLCVQVQEVKARSSQGEVACTRVMCRSTPTSRASSRARNARENRTHTGNGGKGRESGKSGNYPRGKDRDAHVMPSLARTKVENDDWMAPRQRYTSGWGVESSAQAHGAWSDDSDHDDDDDDEEEEGELGLDRLLVPARRQHSIRSLRKHLQRPPSALSGHGAPGTRSPRSGRVSPFTGAPEGDGPWSTNRSREWLASRGEEDEDGYSHVFSGPDVGSGRSGTKWRRGLPGLTQWTTPSGGP
ncbi:hypothetical protein L210DRAFT_960800 [Boletus edulis BED1]|uniref:Uncharacterized protein n=1 Tax=Boletus edulis BED1 TaxID=1328754 RepID=A0AAD4BM30_BOLED|nr:hypothetical protein L210DRAFT_960800 [Boletus edulis BED1]